MRKPIFLTKCGRFVAAMMALMCAVGFNASAASADVLHAGYCDGQANSEGTIVFDDATQVSACMLLDDSTMSRFAGNQVVAIDYYLISKLSISSLTLWVRATPDGENLVEKTLTKSALVKGWNSTTLDNPLDIDGKARYVGYTYTQSRAAYVVATAEGSHVGGLMLKADDGVWSETTGSGVLALECQVKGNNLPQYDGRIDDMSVMSTRIKLGQPLAINGVVTNVAAQPFSSINVTCTSAGMTPMTFEVPLDKTVSYRESCNFGFSFTPNYNAAASDINLTVTINTEDDNADQYKDNSTRSLLYSTYDHDFTKRMVIEEFTSEKCVYCPNAAARLAQALQERGDRAVAICHHSGFSSDDFTVDGIDWDIASAFSLGGNPQFLYDRTSFDGTYLFNPSDYQEFVDAIDYVTATDADIEVNVFASVDKQAHTITAMVKGDVGSNFTDNAPNITLYLLENEVPAVAQKNQYGEVIDGFLHEHIIRAYNDSTWGVPIDISSGSYTYTYTFTYDPDKWDYNNLYLAAFVSQNGSTKATRQVYNANQIELKYIGTHYDGSSDDVLVGDVNNDGVINISDVTALIDLVLGDSDIPVDTFKRADVNADGVVNISDVTALIDLVLR